MQPPFVDAGQGKDLLEASRPDEFAGTAAGTVINATGHDLAVVINREWRRKSLLLPKGSSSEFAVHSWRPSEDNDELRTTNCELKEGFG